MATEHNDSLSHEANEAAPGIIAFSASAGLVLVKALADERGTYVANVLRDLKQRRYDIVTIRTASRDSSSPFNQSSPKSVRLVIPYHLGRVAIRWPGRQRD